MKIIEGQFAGRAITYQERKGRRVTSEKLRKSVFDILKGLLDIEGKKVLDLFAGSGMYGLEALSRGAGYCVFVDRDGKSIKDISAALEILNISGSRAVKSNAKGFLSDTEEVFDLVFADPPYDSLNEELFGSIYKILEEDGLFVIEYSSREDIGHLPNLELEVKREYGDSSVAIFRKTKI